YRGAGRPWAANPRPDTSPPSFFHSDNEGGFDFLFPGSSPPGPGGPAGEGARPRHAETMRLYRNTGSGFEDVTEKVGLARVVPSMGANFGDIDNDGFLDIYLGTGAPSYAALMPNVLFRNQDTRSFVDVPSATDTGQRQTG